MNLSRSSSASRSKNDQKSWRLLFGTLPLLALVFVFTFESAQENDAATRQRASYGTITDCDHTRRGGVYCHYLFSVDGTQHEGVSSDASAFAVGETVLVYYDSQEPAMTALEDFSNKGRKDRNSAYIALLAFVVYSAFILLSFTEVPSSGD